MYGLRSDIHVPCVGSSRGYTSRTVSMGGRLLVLGLWLPSSACVTTTQTVPIRSSPSGATVTIDGSYVGYTPIDVQLKKSASYGIVVAKSGHIQQRVDIVPIPQGIASHLSPASVTIRLQEIPPPVPPPAPPIPPELVQVELDVARECLLVIQRQHTQGHLTDEEARALRYVYLLGLLLHEEAAAPNQECPIDIGERRTATPPTDLPDPSVRQ